MSKHVSIKWLGLSCFKVSFGSQSIVIDPYTGVRGYPELTASANAVYCSHNHGDHNYVEAVKILPLSAESLFSVGTVDTFHDDENGAKRGANLIHLVDVGGFRIAHLGDLGHMLDERQIKEMGRVDVLMVPVGGFYTINAGVAKRIADALNPSVIIPMHYKDGEQGHDVVEGVGPFLSLFDEADIKHIEGDSLVLDNDMGEIVAVMRYAKDAE